MSGIDRAPRTPGIGRSLAQEARRTGGLERRFIPGGSDVVLPAYFDYFASLDDVPPTSGSDFHMFPFDYMFGLLAPVDNDVFTYDVDNYAVRIIVPCMYAWHVFAAVNYPDFTITDFDCAITVTGIPGDAGYVYTDDPTFTDFSIDNATLPPGHWIPDQTVAPASADYYNASVHRKGWGLIPADIVDPTALQVFYKHNGGATGVTWGVVLKLAVWPAFRDLRPDYGL